MTREYNLSFVINAYFKGVSITAKSIEEAKTALYGMTFEDILDAGSVSDFQIEDVTVENRDSITEQDIIDHMCVDAENFIDTYGAPEANEPWFGNNFEDFCVEVEDEFEDQGVLMDRNQEDKNLFERFKKELLNRNIIN